MALNTRSTSKPQDQSKGEFERTVSAWFAEPERNPKLRKTFVVAYQIAQNFNRAEFARTGELVAWPTVRAIGEATGMSKTAVQRHTDKLVEAGLLAIEEGHGRMATRYRGTFVPLWVDKSEPAGADADEGTFVPISENFCPDFEDFCPAPSMGQTSDSTSDRNSEQSSIGPTPQPEEADQLQFQLVSLCPNSIIVAGPELAKPLVQSDAAAGNVVPIKARSRSRKGPVDKAGQHRRSTAADFRRFWEIYPRKDSVVARAASEFHKACLRADVETIIAGAERYAAERADQDPYYTSMAHTWLHYDGWTKGETLKPRSPQPRTNGRRSVNVLDDRFDGDLREYLAAAAGQRG
jgi:hypothetical protein